MAYGRVTLALLAFCASMLCAQVGEAQDAKAAPPVASQPVREVSQEAPVALRQRPPGAVMAEGPTSQASGLPQPRTALPHDLSPWGMFLAADIVVKCVMIGLAFASVLVWTVWLVKTVEILLAGARLRWALSLIAAQPSLAEARDRLGDQGGTASECLAAAESELRLSAGLPDADGIERRTASRIADIEARAIRAVRSGTGLIATIGATAPFVGLFGTVWGIMASFQAIAVSKNTSLAVVAPGIAEALFATAIGLVAAIPAVIFYNKFSADSARLGQRLEAFADEFSAIVSRQIDVRT